MISSDLYVHSKASWRDKESTTTQGSRKLKDIGRGMSGAWPNPEVCCSKNPASTTLQCTTTSPFCFGGGGGGV